MKKAKKTELEVGRAYTVAELEEMDIDPPAPQGAKVPIWELDWELNRNTLQFVLFEICEDALGHFPAIAINEGYARRVDWDYFRALVDWIQSDELPRVPLAKQDRKEWPHLAALVATIICRIRQDPHQGEYWLFNTELLDPVWRWLETAPDLIILPREYGPLVAPEEDIQRRRARLEEYKRTQGGEYLQ